MKNLRITYFKGHKSVVIQDIVIKKDNIEITPTLPYDIERIPFALWDINVLYMQCITAG